MWALSGSPYAIIIIYFETDGSQFGYIGKVIQLETKFNGVLVSNDEDYGMVSTLTFKSSVPSGTEINCYGTYMGDKKSCVVSFKGIAERVQVKFTDISDVCCKNKV